MRSAVRGPQCRERLVTMGLRDPTPPWRVLSWRSSGVVKSGRAIAFTRPTSGRWRVLDRSACSPPVSTASSREITSGRHCARAVDVAELLRHSSAAAMAAVSRWSMDSSTDMSGDRLTPGATRARVAIAGRGDVVVAEEALSSSLPVQQRPPLMASVRDDLAASAAVAPAGQSLPAA